MEFTTWPQVNMINQKNYYTYVFPLNFAISSAFLRIGLQHGREKGSRWIEEGKERCVCIECAIRPEVLPHFVGTSPVERKDDTIVFTASLSRELTNSCTDHPRSQRLS